MVERTPPSLMQQEDWLNTPYYKAYFKPSDDPQKSGWLPKEPYEVGMPRARKVDVGDGHILHAQEYGNPDGEPVIFLHGGPGGQCSAQDPAYFDPKRYRIILFDQRGCGRSTPNTKTDPKGALIGNNTGTMVEDINKIRAAFNIKGKVHLEGGSWGSTLALAYATRYPQNVKSLMLRGIFLGTEPGLRFMFQGNSEEYRDVPPNLNDADFLQTYYSQPMEKFEGAYRAYTPKQNDKDGRIPDELQKGGDHMKLAYARQWNRYVTLIPRGSNDTPGERSNMIKAYDDRLQAEQDPSIPYDPAHPEKSYDPKTNRIAPQYQLDLAMAFTGWEGLISQFSQKVGADGKIDLGKFADPAFAIDFARLEARYTLDGFYMGKDGLQAPKGNENLILDHIDNIARYNIPIMIAHGENDQVCPVRDAYTLEERYKEAQNRLLGSAVEHAPVTMRITPRTGHTMGDKGNTLALIDMINNLAPRMTPDEKEWVGGKGSQAQRIFDQQAERDKIITGRLGK